METRANYAIVGFFTLVVMLSAFGFVYWMARYGSTGETVPLIVRIPGSANGLSNGSPVRFNGIPYGVIRNISIDPAKGLTKPVHGRIILSVEGHKRLFIARFGLGE